MDERKVLLGSHARSAQGATDLSADGADAALAFDLEVGVPDGTLPLLRAAASCAGVEARAPLLDARLARSVVPTAARHKLGRTHGNRLLRDAVADLLPRDALTPEPAALPPIGAWLRGPLRSMFNDLVKAPTARIRTLLHPRAIDEVLRHSLAPRGDARQAWALFALELWARAR
jgi:asparagine synthase (glutamine-hydrolysing)